MMSKGKDVVRNALTTPKQRKLFDEILRDTREAVYNGWTEEEYLEAVLRDLKDKQIALRAVCKKLGQLEILT